MTTPDETAVQVEAWDITPLCVVNRGTMGAWVEAHERLEDTYRVMRQRRPDSTFRLALIEVRGE